MSGTLVQTKNPYVANAFNGGTEEKCDPLVENKTLEKAMGGSPHEAILLSGVQKTEEVATRALRTSILNSGRNSNDASEEKKGDTILDIGSKIEHIVVLCMENRSYDHILGDYDKTTLHELTDLDAPVDITAPHSACAGCLAVKCTCACCFCLASWVSDCCSQKCYPCHDYKVITGSYKKGILPVTHFLKDNYMTCDRYFCSLPGPSYPNKMFLHSGTSLGKTNNDQVSDQSNPQNTIFTELSKNKKTWRVYFDDDTDTRYLDQQKQFYAATYDGSVQSIKSDTGSYRDIKQFFTDVEKGDLAQYTTVEATYNGATENDYHPSSYAPTRNGEKFIGEVYNALKKSPTWKKIALIVTFDEWGGFRDTVVPPKAIRPEPRQSCCSLYDNIFYSAFNQYGPRVPTFVVSEHVKPGSTCSTVLDHTSILKLVTENFELQNAELGNRVAHATPVPLT